MKTRRKISTKQLEAELRALAIVYPDIAKLSPLLDKACYSIGTFYYHYEKPQPMIDIINKARQEAGVKTLIPPMQARKSNKLALAVQKPKPVNPMRHYPIKYLPAPMVLRWVRRRSDWTKAV